MYPVVLFDCSTEAMLESLSCRVGRFDELRCELDSVDLIRDGFPILVGEDGQMRFMLDRGESPLSTAWDLMVDLSGTLSTRIVLASWDRQGTPEFLLVTERGTLTTFVWRESADSRSVLRMGRGASSLFSSTDADGIRCVLSSFGCTRLIERFPIAVDDADYWLGWQCPDSLELWEGPLQSALRAHVADNPAGTSEQFNPVTRIRWEPGGSA
jgi:hypothetical protein